MEVTDRLFEGKSRSSCSTGTNYVLDYCMAHDMDCPSWLHCHMKDWDRVIMDDLANKMEETLYNTGIALLDMNDHNRLFAEYVLYIMDELEGKWGIIIYGEHTGCYAFELEHDAVAFKLRWT